MSNLFRSFLDAIPINRFDMVNELFLDNEYDTISPYIPDDVEEYIASRHVSLMSGYLDFDGDGRTLSSDSSLALSRAMTDSDIDYDWFRRLKTMTNSRALDDIQTTLDAFPPGYILSLYDYYTDIDVTPALDTYVRCRAFEEDLRGKMRRYFDEECCVFAADDPGLFALEEAIDSLNDQLQESIDYTRSY